jgi:hypothetical protein
MNSLPADPMLHLSRYMPVTDLVRLSMTCKQLRRVVMANAAIVRRSLVVRKCDTCRDGLAYVSPLCGHMYCDECRLCDYTDCRLCSRGPHEPAPRWPPPGDPGSPKHDWLVERLYPRADYMLSLAHHEAYLHRMYHETDYQRIGNGFMLEYRQLIVLYAAQRAAQRDYDLLAAKARRERPLYMRWWRVWGWR